tara:strand:- start:14824 stop:15072 length:249 start_codon:yes stop_codon:yes gene_type:complete
MDVFVFFLVIIFIAVYGFLLKSGNEKALDVLGSVTGKLRSWKAFYLVRVKRPLQSKRGKWLLISLMGLFYVVVISYYFISTE